MAPSRRQSNGRSPLVNQQRQITTFFTKASSSTSPSPSPSPRLPKESPKSNLKVSSGGESPSPTTPSPIETKQRKPLLVIGPSSTSPSTPASISAAEPKTSSKCYGQEVVNKRIRVYWPLDQSWYEGVIVSFDKTSGKHLVQYDDAEEELLDLANERIDWVEETEKRFRRLRRLSVIEDEDEGENVEEAEDGGDDSSDEDWVKNAGEEVAEDVLDDMDLDEEGNEENEVGNVKRRQGKTPVSRKRKTSAGKLESSKKSKSGDAEKRGLKVPLDGSGPKLMEPTDNNDCK